MHGAVATDAGECLACSYTYGYAVTEERREGV